MNRGSRRSMGTVKIDSKPQRMSSGQQQSQGSNSVRKSKLPKLTAGSSASKSRGRSGSMEPPSRFSAAVGGGGFKTPRSKSAFNRTPTSTRQPLLTIPQNSAARGSLNGPKRSSIYGAATHNKENRPINDKEWQREVVRDLVDFCITNGYHNAALTLKDFYPINTTTFRSIFEFLYGFLVPGYSLPDPKSTPMHEVLTEILKKMNYPGTVSKSHFQTLGGPSWGNIVGVLHFLLSCAQLFVNLSSDDVFIKGNFPNEDEDGFIVESDKRSKSEVEYSFFRRCYRQYNRGQDDFPEEEDQLYFDLMESKGVDEESIARLEQQLQQLKNENRELKDDTGDLEALTEELSKVQSDIKGLQDYLEKQQKYFTQKQLDLKTTKDNLELFYKAIDDLRESIIVLEAECHNKGIDPKDNTNHVEESVLALQARVDAKKADIEEIDKFNWDLEQKIGKRMALLDQCRRDFNRLLISLDIEESDVKSLKNAAPEDVQSLIQKLNVSLKEDLQRLKKNNENLKQSLSLCMTEVDKKSKELVKTKQEESKAKDEKTRLFDEIQAKEEDLNGKLKQAKDKLAMYFKNKHQLGIDLKGKEVQYEIATKENQEAKVELQAVKEEGHLVLDEIMKRMKKLKEEELKERDQAFRKYAEYSQKLSKVLKEETGKMEQKLKKMKEKNN